MTDLTIEMTINLSLVNGHTCKYSLEFENKKMLTSDHKSTRKTEACDELLFNDPEQSHNTRMEQV